MEVKEIEAHNKFMNNHTAIDDETEEDKNEYGSSIRGRSEELIRGCF
jgi:hypothetical protein